MESRKLWTQEGRSAGKRILFLVSSMQGGGAERVASLLCNRWAEKGHHVTLMATFSRRGTSSYELDRRVRLVFLADYARDQGAGLLSKINRFATLRRLVKSEKPDILVSFLARVNVAAMISASRLRTRIVLSERNNPHREPLSPLVRILRRFTYRYADVVVAQTASTAEWIERHCRSRNVMIIPNPVVMPLVDSEPRVAPSTWITERKRLLLAVGRLAPQKGFSVLLEAFASLASEFPEWDLAILGEGPLRGQLEGLREIAGLKSRVHLPGRVGNPGDWYARADLYVLSSAFEGFPNTLLEAMAHGVPAVSFDCESGPRDIIVNGVNGRLVQPGGGAGGLAEALRSLMGDETARKETGRAALAVQEQFSIDSIDDKWARALGTTE